MKPLNSGHLPVFKNLSVIESWPLLGGNLKKNVTFGTKCFVGYLCHVRFLGCPLLGRFTVSPSENVTKFRYGSNDKMPMSVLVIVCLRGKFGINLSSSVFWNFKISKNERGTFSPTFTNKHVILVNHMWQALQEHTRVRITQETINQYWRF